VHSAGISRNLLGYAALCLIALAYLAAANAEGYVPFASPTARASQHTANHFHK
jgi:hypothetical protein